jgi:TonB family protein
MPPNSLKRTITVFIFLAPLLLFAQSHVQSEIAGTHVDQMPTYPGGMKALAKLFVDSIDLPNIKWQERAESDDHPEITLSLVINEQGKVEDVKVLKSINPKTDARCVSLARKLKFTPAMLGGKPVKVTYKLPLKFDMEF